MNTEITIFAAVRKPIAIFPARVASENAIRVLWFWEEGKRVLMVAWVGDSLWELGTFEVEGVSGHFACVKWFCI